MSEIHIIIYSIIAVGKCFADSYNFNPTGRPLKSMFTLKVPCIMG
nr:MAG TPA: hypothetical protein [Caudoviricetes sp.]